MHRLFTLLLLSATALSLYALQASPPVKLKVNGIEVVRYVKEISMDENSVQLRWNDNTTLNDRIAKIMLKLADSECIDRVRLFAVDGLQERFLLVEGFPKESEVSIYNTAGKKLIQATTGKDSVLLDISRLNVGIYFLKNKHTVLKFVKR